MTGRRLRLRVARLLYRAGARVLPPSPCAVRDWQNHPRCNGDSCPACGSWEHPTGKVSR